MEAVGIASADGNLASIERLGLGDGMGDGGAVPPSLELGT